MFVSRSALLQAKNTLQKLEQGKLGHMLWSLPLYTSLKRVIREGERFERERRRLWERKE